jgi:hypothetical protein
VSEDAGILPDLPSFDGVNEQTPHTLCDLLYIAPINEIAVFAIPNKINRTTTTPGNGNGAEPGTPIDTCVTCGGAGRVQQVTRTAFGQMIQATACPACGGSFRATRFGVKDPESWAGCSCYPSRRKPR